MFIELLKYRTEISACGLLSRWYGYISNYMYIVKITRKLIHQFIEDGSNVVHQSGPFMNDWLIVAELSASQLFCNYELVYETSPYIVATDHHSLIVVPSTVQYSIKFIKIELRYVYIVVLQRHRSEVVIERRSICRCKLGYQCLS